MEIQSIMLLIGAITAAILSIMKVIKKSNCFKHCIDIETNDQNDNVDINALPMTSV